MTAPGPEPADLRAALAAAARTEQVLFATDFDGVLAPLGDDPMAVRPVPGSMEALRELAELPGVTVAIVSGRDLETLALLTGVSATPDPAGEPIVLLGSHGGQSSRPDLLAHPELSEAAGATLAALDAGLEQVCAAHPGARIERKPAAVVLHTRGMEPEAGAAAERDALALADAHPGTHPLRGKNVVELAVVDVTKGSALGTIAHTLQAGATCYFGDDVTDESVFEALAARPSEPHVGVKVGAGPTAAAFRVVDEAAVVEAFEAFLEARRETHI